MKVLIATTSCESLGKGHPTGLWLEEFAVPFNALTAAGVEIVVASPRGGSVPLDPKTNPSDNQKIEWGDALRALTKTEKLSDVHPDHFDGIFIPGGHGPMVDLVRDPDLIDLIETFDHRRKLIAAVCHGPVALLNAESQSGENLVRGRKLTAFSNMEERFVMLHEVVPFLLEDALKKNGALFEASLVPMMSHVVHDGNLLTGQNPASSKKIAEMMVEILRNNDRGTLRETA